MHNLHLILIKADSAEDAASEAENAILDWGNENNWRCVGGVASEDGSDDIENHEDGRWALSFLDKQDGIAREGTYFSRAAAYLHRHLTEPVTASYALFSNQPTIRSAIAELAGMLLAFDPDRGNTLELWGIGRSLEHLSELIDSRRGRKLGNELPEFYERQFDQFGLTDMTGESEGARRYLVFLDMHS